MTDLPAWVQSGVTAVGGSSVVLGFLYLIGKWIDKRRPDHEVLGDINEDLRKTVQQVSSQLHTYEDDLKRLRDELTKHSIRLHKMTLAIHECVMEYPETTRWWADRLAKMEPQ